MDEQDVEVESTRAAFEEAVFRKYFISRVARDLTLKGKVIEKAELLKRKKKGGYKRPEIAAMWYGWKLHREHELLLKRVEAGNPTSA